MIKVNAMGDACPIPVIKTKNAIREMNGAGQVEVLVDNEIAVQNLTKMAKQKGYQCQSEKISDDEYKVMITVPEGNESNAADQGTAINATHEGAKANQGAAANAAHESEGAAGTAGETAGEDAGQTACLPASRKKKKIVVLRSGKMGEGNDELGAVLMKGFIYALTELDNLPETILLYNGGAPLSCEGSDSLEDLKTLEAQGVEIMTCGTCLNYYGLSDKLAVGTVTNMYAIAEKMSEADTIICP